MTIIIIGKVTEITGKINKHKHKENLENYC